MLNVLDALNKREQAKVKLMYAESQEEAVKERNKFEGAFGQNSKAVQSVVRTGSV